MDNQEHHISYIIEKNIPLPEAEEFNFPFDKMEIGDSFFMPLVEWVFMGISSNGGFLFWQVVERDAPKDCKYKVRPAIQNGHNGCRVWRIK